MLGFVKRLFGKRKSSAAPVRAAHSKPRSVTADLLAQGRREAAGQTAAKRTAENVEFDPYNTGKFDRAASWERVRHSHR